MVRLFGVLLVAAGLLGIGLGMRSSDGQVILRGGGDEAMVILEEVDGVYPLVFQLMDDEGWLEAKAALLERAAGPDRFQVIHALTQTRRHQEEKVQVRIDSVVSGLTEVGLYPITEADLKQQVKALSVVLRKVEMGRPSAEIASSVVLAMVRAREELEAAHAMIETGKEPQEGARAPTRGVIIGRGEN